MVLPRKSLCSIEICPNKETSGRQKLVGSKRPPTPTSNTAYSHFVSKK